jgi:hypothetical protein
MSYPIPSPLSSRPERSGAEGPAVSFSQFPRKALKNAAVRQPLSTKRNPLLCHPERSRGICSSADLSWKCFVGGTLSLRSETTRRMLSGLVSGHDLSRAVQAANDEGFSPCVRTRFLKGTGFSPYINHQRRWALAPEGISCACLSGPRRLKPIRFDCEMHGLKAVPFKKVSSHPPPLAPVPLPFL